MNTINKTLRGSFVVLAMAALSSAASADTVIIDTFTTASAGCMVSGGFIGDNCSQSNPAAEAQGGTRSLYAERSLQDNLYSVATSVSSGFYNAGTGPDAGGIFRITYTPVNADLTGGGSEAGFLFRFGADIAGSNMTVNITDGLAVNSFTGAVASTASMITDWFVPFSLFSSNCATCVSADKIEVIFNNSMTAIDLQLDSITTFSNPSNNTPVPATVMLLGLGMLFLRRLFK
jgi:hypothetical protein